MVQAQQHDIIQQTAVELDVQHAVHPHQVVGGCQRLAAGVLHGGGLALQVVDHEHVVLAVAAVGFKALGLVQQIEDASDAAANVAHALALAGVIGGKGGIQGTIDVAHGFRCEGVVFGAQFHLRHSLLPLLHEQAFQCRVLLHSTHVGAAQQQPVHRTAQTLERLQLAVFAILQIMPAHQDLRLRRLPDAKRLTHHAALEQRAKDAAARRTALEESLAALAARSEACRTEITAIRKAKTDSQTEIAAKEKAIREATEKRLERQQAETETLARARTSADSREEMGREMARLAERKAAAETEYDQTVAKLWDEYQLSVSQAEELCIEFESLTALRAQVADLRGKIRALGSVNVSAIEEYKEVKARYDALVRQVTDVEESRSELSRMISKLSAQMKEIFSDSFRAINENFGRVFTELFGGGEASLVLEDETDVLSCGIGIRVAPPGKVIKNLEALSGGEQALVAISIYFAILAVNPAPFCILDEIEAALDDANVVRFAQYLRRVSDKTQFIVITHRRGTMEAANVLYGVTMQEDGVSKLLKLDLEQVDATLVS